MHSISFLLLFLLLCLTTSTACADYTNEDAFHALLDDPTICGELHSKHDIEEFLYIAPFHNLLGQYLPGYWMVDAPIMPRDQQRCIVSPSDPQQPGIPVCVYHEPDQSHSNWYFIGCDLDNTLRPTIPATTHDL